MSPCNDNSVVYFEGRNGGRVSVNLADLPARPAAPVDAEPDQEITLAKETVTFPKGDGFNWRLNADVARDPQKV